MTNDRINYFSHFHPFPPHCGSSLVFHRMFGKIGRKEAAPFVQNSSNHLALGNFVELVFFPNVFHQRSSGWHWFKSAPLLYLIPNKCECVWVVLHRFVSLNSWCLGFLVSKFPGVKVSWFQNSEVWNFQSFNDSILPNFHFMFSGRYWSRIQDFQEFIRRIVGIFRHPSFPKVSKNACSFLWYFKP